MLTEVCVVAYGNEDTIERLVDSIAPLPGVGVALHDNGPAAGTLEVARKAAERRGLPFRGETCSRGNCGFGAGCNALAATSSAEDLLFLNPDAAVVAWPDGLRAAGRIVGAQVVDEQDRPSLTWGTRRRLWDEVRLRWLRRPPHPPQGRGYVSGAALLVERSTFTQLGGFDEAYFMYYEDIDLCHRAMDASVPVVLDERWKVVHLGGHSVGRSIQGLSAALLRSYDSGRRFHRRRGHGTRRYDLLCLVDAAARAVAFTALPRTRNVGRANTAVVRASARGLTGRQP